MHSYNDSICKQAEKAGTVQKNLYRKNTFMAKNITILVVDDEPDIITLLESRLSSHGFTVLKAYNGKEGLDAAIAHTPNLILLDLMMPVMDGYEATKQLRSNQKTKKIPIILFTAAPAEIVAQKGEETMEAVDYVIKPFDDAAINFLISRIKELVK